MNSSNFVQCHFFWHSDRNRRRWKCETLKGIGPRFVIGCLTTDRFSLCDYRFEAITGVRLNLHQQILTCTTIPCGLTSCENNASLKIDRLKSAENRRNTKIHANTCDSSYAPRHRSSNNPPENVQGGPSRQIVASKNCRRFS